ncbi:hypothetical protein V8E36_001137 [Tilletia maclaganii]
MSTSTMLASSAAPLELVSNGIFDFDDADEEVDELQSDTEDAVPAAKAAPFSTTADNDPDFDDGELDALAAAHVMQPLGVSTTSNLATAVRSSTANISPAKAALNAFGSKPPVYDDDEPFFDFDAEIAADEAEQASQEKENAARTAASAARTLNTSTSAAQDRAAKKTSSRASVLTGLGSSTNSAAKTTAARTERGTPNTASSVSAGTRPVVSAATSRPAAQTTDGAADAMKRLAKRRADLQRSKTVPSLAAKPIPPILKSVSLPEIETPESFLTALTAMAARIRTKLKARGDDIEPVRPPARPSKSNASGSALWVDKYQPQHFTELLGDDRLHREAMGWLKQWDACVFKRKAKKRPCDAAPELDGGKAPWADPWGRPQERVLLISGPPGLGKTTLVHIMAKQAGYGVFELNASDARNAGAVENVVKMALQSASLKNPKKPTLVLVDEIDGATGGGGGSAGMDGGGSEGGFVRALIKLIEGGKGSKGKGKDKKPVGKPLLRPIICVCNDAYAPALRGLRPMAKMIRYHRPPTQTLVKRLKEVCAAEDMRADTRSLSILVDLAQGDVRASINALQFLRTRTSSITERDIHGAASALGLKDGGANVHRVWDILFHAPSSRERARSLDPRDTRLINEQIVNESSLCGDFDKVALGCFEHYPKLVLADDGWARFKEIHEWLYFAGCLQDSVWKSGGATFDLFGFLPWTFVQWHHLFANTKNTMPEYPRADYEHFLKRTAFSEITTSLHGSLPPTLRTQFNAPAVITELGPSLMRMLNPDLRPVNNQLVRTEERRTMAALVNIMLHLNLRFVQDRTEDGSLVMRLEPPLDAFVQYDGRRSKDVAASRFAVRQLAVKEMDVEVRRRRAGLRGEDTELTGRSAGAQKVLAQYLPDGGREGGRGGEGGAESAFLKTRPPEKAAVDFFGRAILKEVKPLLIPKISGDGKGKGKAVTTSSSSRVGPLGFEESDLGHAGSASTASGDHGDEQDVGEDGERPSKKVKVFFRYHEGFSNAVRKKITLSQLL